MWNNSAETVKFVNKSNFLSDQIWLKSKSVKKTNQTTNKKRENYFRKREKFQKIVFNYYTVPPVLEKILKPGGELSFTSAL